MKSAATMFGDEILIRDAWPALKANVERHFGMLLRVADLVPTRFGVVVGAGSFVIRLRARRTRDSRCFVSFGPKSMQCERVRSKRSASPPDVRPRAQHWAHLRGFRRGVASSLRASTSALV
jgi:hypothetical protein